MEHAYHALGFSEAQLSAGSHICFFYENDRDRLETVSSFASSGLVQGEKCVLIIAEEMEFDLKASMAPAISATQALKSGQLSFEYAKDIMGMDGDIDSDDILLYFTRIVTDSISSDWPIVRVVMDGNYLLDRLVDKTEWIRFEVKLNSRATSMPAIIMCEYALKTISGQFFMNILRTHPFVVVDGVFLENKFLLEPSSFLRLFDRQNETAN